MHGLSIPWKHVKAHPFTELQSTVGSWCYELFHFGFIERSYIHANWYTEVRHSSESPTDPMLLWAKDSCWQKFHLVRKGAANMSTTVYLGKRFCGGL